MVIIAVQNAKLFFPQRKTLKTFSEGYSPILLEKLVYAGTAASSFAQARELLMHIAGISISIDHLQALTIRVGKEMITCSENAAVTWIDTETDKQLAGPVATVSIDGGRAQIRAAHQGAGVHANQWKETKVACLQIFNSSVFEQDPHPLLPTVFREKDIVKKLVNGLKGYRKNNQQEDIQSPEMELKIKLEAIKKDSKYLSAPLTRFCLATVATAEEFGNLVLHKVHQENLHTAERKAFLGDGDKKNWAIYDSYFGKASGWVPILDFVHAVEYAFNASKAASVTELECWDLYINLITSLWQGKVLKVLRTLDHYIKQFGSSDLSDATERKEKLQKIRNYFQNNYTRMDYQRYRQQGLPISSCHVESLIKQYNLRVKSTEKFWNESSLKGILALKSALLSEDSSWAQHWSDRYEFQANTKRHYLKKVA